MFFSALTGLAQVTSAFGWEDPVEGVFHHELITKAAADKAGWSVPVAAELAWHCDYVDSYLYNPLFWAPGGLPRVKVALATGPALAKLHFDDLTSTDQIHTMWRRYTSGTVAGLVWAWWRNDVDAARNVVGASLHALQDFYAHSNWVDDPARRGETYQATAPADRLRLPLWTGTYEQGEHLGIKPHGKPNLLCGLLKDTLVSGIENIMEIACHAASPLGNSSLCQVWRDCQNSEAARPTSVLGIPIPANVYYLAPPGIAIDSTWQAGIAQQVRGLTDLDGAQLFELAYSLATTQSKEWLVHLEQVMKGIGAGDFWASVSSGPVTAGAREHQFENFSQLPHLFLAAGPFPPPPEEPADDWYLRVRLVTGRDPDAGTDADIVAHLPDQSEVLLDYMPRAHPLLAYNDFEAGDDQVHMLGPFRAMPDWIELENRSATVGDVFEALGQSFIDAVESAAKAVRDVLLGLIGGPADFVGQTKKVWSPTDLAALADEQTEPFDLFIDGKSEGKWEVHGTIRRVGRSQEGPLSWSEYAVHLNRLHCRQESRWDGISSSDEPILFALLVNQAEGAVQRYSALFENVDTGASRTLDSQWGNVRVPDESGYLTLPVQLLESDLEGRSDRRQAMDAFAERVQVDIEPERAGFLDKLAASIKPDWQLARLEVLAFTRGQTVTIGNAFTADVNRWIRGRQRARFPLELTHATTVPVWPELPAPPTPIRYLTDLSPQATWQGAQLTDDSGNTQNGQALAWNGNDGDSRGFVRLGPLHLEDGTTVVALWTHPMWVDNGTIKGWHPDVVLPAHAHFEAQVGFRRGATATSGVRFRVFEHHNRPDGRRVWNQIVDIHKTYTGQLATIQADLSHLAGVPVGLELRVDAGTTAVQDWAVWVNSRITSTTPLTRTYLIKAGDTLSLIAQRHGLTLAALLAANPSITNPDRIRAGDVLTLPSP